MTYLVRRVKIDPRRTRRRSPCSAGPRYTEAIRISDVVEDIGYSQRHVRNLFRRWVGLSPKEFGSLRRFQQVLATLARETAQDDPTAALELRGERLSEPNWAEVAADHGYYDQSHLIHDFRRYAGMTPGTYAESFRGLENYLPLD